MKPRGKLALERPTRAAAAASTKSRAATRFEDGTARIVVEVPTSLHRALKHRALERGISVKAYILGLLEADGLG